MVEFGFRWPCPCRNYVGTFDASFTFSGWLGVFQECSQLSRRFSCWLESWFRHHIVPSDFAAAQDLQIVLVQVTFKVLLFCRRSGQLVFVAHFRNCIINALGWSKRNAFWTAKNSQHFEVLEKTRPIFLYVVAYIAWPFSQALVEIINRRMLYSTRSGIQAVSEFSPTWQKGTSQKCHNFVNIL